MFGPGRFFTSEFNKTKTQTKGLEEQKLGISNKSSIN
jgi:hypothetical protein